MRSLSAGVCRSLAFVAVVASINAIAAFGDPPDNKLSKVLDDWKTRQNQTTSIHYEIEGVEVTPKGRYTGDKDLPADLNGPVPSQDHSSPKKVSLFIDFDRGWFYKSLHEESFYISSTVSQAVHP